MRTAFLLAALAALMIPSALHKMLYWLATVTVPSFEFPQSNRMPCRASWRPSPPTRLCTGTTALRTT